jgi:hypothetical protein
VNYYVSVKDIDFQKILRSFGRLRTFWRALETAIQIAKNQTSSHSQFTTPQLPVTSPGDHAAL